MDDLGVAKMIVGIQIKREGDHAYSITQEKLANSILVKSGMDNAKAASTPLPVTYNLTKGSEDEARKFKLKNLPYRSVVDLLMYLIQCTFPDLSHAVGILSQHLETPTMLYWTAALHVLRYLRGTTNWGRRYCGDEGESMLDGQHSHDFPEAMCDSDWAGDKDSHRSTTGYEFKLAGGPIS